MYVVSARYQIAAAFSMPMPVTGTPSWVGLSYGTPLTVFAPLPSESR